MNEIDYSALMPIFPLPNVVLLPRAMLPLHIFEARYRAMTRDALDGARLIALALLERGFEPRYDSLEAAIHPGLCVGRILDWEELPDGRFNFLLRGMHRVKVVEENKERSYRRAVLRPVADTPVPPSADRELRGRLHAAMSGPWIRDLAEDSHWLDLLACPAISLTDLADALGGAILGATADRQAFLSQQSIETRVEMLVVAVGALADCLAADPSMSGPGPDRLHPWSEN